MQQNAADSRVLALDVLRGIAALAVVLFHYTSKFPDFHPAAGTPPFTFPHGSYGVELFFMISGFVILMTLDRSKGKGFVWSRFLRLYPLYWTCVLVTFTVLSTTSLIPFDVSFGAMLFNLTMLQDYFKLPVVDGVYWSLTYELGFYVFMYGLFRLRLDRWIAHLPVAMSALAVLYLFAKPFIPHPLNLVLVFHQYSHLFACGLAFYLMRTRGFSWPLALVVAAAPCIEYFYFGVVGLVAVGCAALLMCLAALRTGSLPSMLQPLVWLGGISYGLYLIHQMVGYVLLAAMERAGIDPAVAIAATVVIIVALASLLTYGVERPLARALRGLYRPHERAAATA